jgi:hypothetical protein
MNKTQTIERCKKILHCYKPNEVLNDNDFNFMCSIFEMHSEWEQKKGVGIKSISVIKTKYGTKCMVLNRHDGTYTDISYMHSINQRTDIQKIKMACRSAIRPIIDEYKYKNVLYGVSKCPFTLEILTETNTHIDHYDMPFIKVFESWIEKQNVSYLATKINKTIDNNFDTYFTDVNIAYDFKQFHNANTHLRAVSKKANLTLLKP